MADNDKCEKEETPHTIDSREGLLRLDPKKQQGRLTIHGQRIEREPLSPESQKSDPGTSKEN